MEYIKNINVPMTLLAIISVRMLFPDASLALSLFGLGLTGLYAYNRFLQTKYTKSLDQSVKEDLEAMRSVISGMAVKNNVKPVDKNIKFF